jgi:hypothetical protein
MSGQPAPSGSTVGNAAPRVLLVEDGKTCDVFDVIDLTDGVVRARSPYLFEIGEELRVRVEREGTVRDATARVLRHTGSDDDRVTELELADQSEPRRMVSG